METERRPVRRRVLYSGRVQGVGFRYTTASIAADFAVAGSVRNLADGRVELIVEATPEELAAFLVAIKAAFQGYIEGVCVENMEDGDRLVGFHIRH